MKNMDKISQRA
jgi:hypothetical protein